MRHELSLCLTHIVRHFYVSSPLCLSDSLLTCDTSGCVFTYVWHVLHQESLACSDMTALPWSPVCVCVCVVSARWPLITPTCRKWHMSTAEPQVMSNLTFSCHMTYTLTSCMANKEFVVSSSLSELREHKKSAEIEWISICIISLYLLIHDSTASLLNAGSSKEISLPEDWRAGQLHSLD